jgi:hypothetical protein
MSVTVRPYRGGGFEVDILWRSQDGRRHRERKRLDIPSRSAAQRWGEGRERELLIRGPTFRRKEVPTLEQFAPRFMDGHVRANQAKPSGIAHKELVFKNHLFPMLGAKRLDDITDEDVQQLKYKLRHRKPRTVNNVLTVLESHVADLLIKVAREAGMPPHGPHTLRHTFCSHLAMRGAAVGAIRALAGHQDLMTTQRYMHLSSNLIDDTIRLLEAPRSRKAPRRDIVKTLAGASASD